MKRQREHTSNSRKAPYVSPELKVYGKISELTHSGGTNAVDGFGGSQTGFIPQPPVSDGLK